MKAIAPQETSDEGFERSGLDGLEFVSGPCSDPVVYEGEFGGGAFGE